MGLLAYTPGMRDSSPRAVRFLAASDQTLLVSFGERISTDAHRQGMKLLRLLQSEPLAGGREVQPAYASVLIRFDAPKLGRDELESVLRGYLGRLSEIKL